MATLKKGLEVLVVMTHRDQFITATAVGRNPAKSNSVSLASGAAAAHAYEARISEAIEDGFSLLELEPPRIAGREVTDATHEGFERRIDESPDDQDAYLVYADWLTMQGDPRGEFITTQHAVAQGGDTQALVARERELRAIYTRPLDGLVEQGDVSCVDEKHKALRLEWRLGFVRKIGLAHSPGYEAQQSHANLRALVCALLTHPSCRFWRNSNSDPSCPCIAATMSSCSTDCGTQCRGSAAS